MKKKLFSAIALVMFLAAPALAEVAIRGLSTANLNLRSGPSTAYPAVVVIPTGASLTVHGCLSVKPWCDVSFSGGRGWVAGRYIATTFRKNRVYVEPRYYHDLGVPVITFEAGRYWDRHYRDRDFYRERDRWRRPPPSGSYWNVPPPRGDWDRSRLSDEWRDGRRNDWRDTRRGGWLNDGRWKQHYGDWNQDDRLPRDYDRGRWEDQHRNQDWNQGNRKRGNDDGSRLEDKNQQPQGGGAWCRPGDRNCDGR